MGEKWASGRNELGRNLSTEHPNPLKYYATKMCYLLKIKTKNETHYKDYEAALENDYKTGGEKFKNYIQ